MRQRCAGPACDLAGTWAATRALSPPRRVGPDAIAVGRQRERHRQGAAIDTDGAEPEAFVETHRRVSSSTLRLSPESPDRRASAIGARSSRVPIPCRRLPGAMPIESSGMLLVDEAVTGIARSEQPPPRRPDRDTVLGDEPNVAAPWPADDVAGERGDGEDLGGGPHRRPRSPVRGLRQHPLEERRRRWRNRAPRRCRAYAPNDETARITLVGERFGDRRDGVGSEPRVGLGVVGDVGDACQRPAARP